jgi:hypothetical protein
MPILMLTAADRLDNKPTGFGLSNFSLAVAELAEQFPEGHTQQLVRVDAVDGAGRPVATGPLRL